MVRSSRRTLAQGLFAFAGALTLFSFPSLAQANSRRAAVLNGKYPYPRTATLPIDIPAKAGTRAPQATGLTFDFGDGWTSDAAKDMKSKLATYIRLVQPIITNVYGSPSPTQDGKKVLINNTSEDTSYHPPSDTTTNPLNGGAIYMDATGQSLEINQSQLVPFMLAAYHGRALFNVQYTNDGVRIVEPWEFGFEDAAGLIVQYQALGSPSNFNASDHIFAYVGPYYDYLNRPNLGNLSYNAGSVGIADLRAAMAAVAWLKVAAENPNFFKAFNTKYYTAFTSDRSVAGNASTLRSIAAEVVPSVEGQSFQDWFRRQYALDTAVTVGQKLYVGIAPAYKGGFGDGTMGIFVENFSTAPDGTDTALQSIGSLAAFDENGTDVSSKSSLATSNTFQTDPPSTDTDAHPGEFFGVLDFSGVGSPDQALITTKARIGALEASGYFPHGVTGTSSTAIGYCGGVLGAKTGTLNIQITGGASASTTVTRATWQKSLTYPSGPAVKTTFTLGGKTFIRNTSWFTQSGSAFRMISFLLDATPNTGDFTMNIAAGASKLRMISLPLYPAAGDEAAILGIPKDTLQLARYRSNLSPQPVGEGSLPFGIGGDRHELYPNISTPMGPGRGYWLGTDGAASSRSIAGAEPNKSTSFEVPLSGGWAPKDASDLNKGYVETGAWNQIGVPFNRAYAPNAIKVRYGGFAPVPFATAVSRGWVGSGIWRWLPAGGYEDVTRTSTKLQPFEGYYVYTALSRGVYLVFDPNAAAVSVPAVAGWRVAITAATSANRDRSNSLGVSALAVPAAKPPTGARVVTVRFLSSGTDSADSSGAGSATGWADSFLPALDKTGTWTFLVDGTKSGQTVTLSWPDVTSVPADIRLRLIDTVNLKTTAITTGRSYAFTSKGIPRKFRVEATRMALPTLSVTAAPSTGYTITLNSNVAFTGKLEVRSEGSVVATLATGDFNAGKTTFPWSAKDASGKKLPGGIYRIWITPAEGTGTESKAVVELK